MRGVVGCMSVWGPVVFVRRTPRLWLWPWACREMLYVSASRREWLLLVLPVRLQEPPCPWFNVWTWQACLSYSVGSIGLKLWELPDQLLQSCRFYC